MNIQEFQRWAEGQRVPASVRALVSAEAVPSEQIGEDDEVRAPAAASSEGSPSGARRFLGTLRWGK